MGLSISALVNPGISNVVDSLTRIAKRALSHEPDQCLVQPAVISDDAGRTGENQRRMAMEQSKAHDAPLGLEPRPVSLAIRPGQRPRLARTALICPDGSTLAGHKLIARHPQTGLHL